MIHQRFPLSSGGICGGLKLLFGNRYDLHQAFLEADFQDAVAVDGNDRALEPALHGVDVVAAVDPGELRHAAAGHGLHTASSRISLD